MYKNAKQGWYRLTHPEKFRKALDETMKSSKSGYVMYKSSLELKAIKYADAHPRVTRWSLEPFAIPYIRPDDGKIHRYFPDLVLQQGDATIIIEIKHSSEVAPPKRKNTRQWLTWYINQAKWDAARKFCKEKKIHFCILTEKDL